MPPSKVPCLRILDQNNCCASKACMLANWKEAKGENSLRHKWELGGSGIKACKSIPEDESQRWRRTFCNTAHALTCSSNSFVFSKRKQGYPAEKLSHTQKADQPFTPPRTWVLKSPCAGEVQERQFWRAAEISCMLQCSTGNEGSDGYYLKSGWLLVFLHFTGKK